MGDTPALDFGGANFGQPGAPDWDGYAVFGRVVEGMEVVRRINASLTGTTVERAYMRSQCLIPPVAIV
jgi:peptidyl-prolyl cis-trans isomerase A (cyclophilin A)